MVGARTMKDQMIVRRTNVVGAAARGNSRLSGGSSKDLSRLRLQRSDSARAWLEHVRAGGIALTRQDPHPH
jgi:hypothetical protein